MAKQRTDTLFVFSPSSTCQMLNINENFGNLSYCVFLKQRHLTFYKYISLSIPEINYFRFLKSFPVDKICLLIYLNYLSPSSNNGRWISACSDLLKAKFANSTNTSCLCIQQIKQTTINQLQSEFCPFWSLVLLNQPTWPLSPRNLTWTCLCP